MFVLQACADRPALTLRCPIISLDVHVTPSERLFIDCLHQDPASLDARRLAALAQPDWDALLEMARRQRVRPLIRRRLIAPDVRDAVPVPVIEALTLSCRAIAQRNLVLHAELERLLAVLGGAGIPAIVLKGMHLASAVYGDIGLREIGDIDLLVKREHLERATSLVLDAGYAPVRAFDIDVDVAVSNHVTRLCKPPYLVVELHWNLTAPGQTYTIDPSSPWDRTRPLEAAGTRAGNAFALSLEDSILYLCQHLSYHHRFDFGIRSLCDIAELARRRSSWVRWDLVVRGAEQWNWLRGVRLSLQLASDLLGAAVMIPACPASDPMSAAVLTDATAHLLAVEGAESRLGQVGGVMTPGAWPKIRYVATVIRLTPAQLRQAYPGVAVTPWFWWTVYLLRCRDLLKRHTFVLLRMFVLREPVVRSAAARQQRLREYLLDS